MKNKIILLLGLIQFMLISSCNPYFRIHTGISSHYLFDEENKVLKISEIEQGDLQGNNIYITLPDSLGGKNAHGNFSYIIQLTDQLQLEKIILYSANFVDSVDNISFKYAKYDSNKRLLYKPKGLISPYDSYFQTQIKMFSYTFVNKPDNTNRVYCNFIVRPIN